MQAKFLLLAPNCYRIMSHQPPTYSLFNFTADTNLKGRSDFFSQSMLVVYFFSYRKSHSYLYLSIA